MQQLISIVIPAFNEEKNVSIIANAINNVFENINYNYEIIFVDDGSKDNTYQKVKAAFTQNSRIKVFTKPNGGKASALNYGINQSHADFVVCIDADTKLAPESVSLLMKHFLFFMHRTKIQLNLFYVYKQTSARARDCNGKPTRRGTRRRT